MKIIIIGTAHPYRGGLATFNERMATQFQNEGHHVEIYTFTLQYPNFLFPGKTQYSDEKATENLQIVRKINSCHPFNWIKIGREIRQKKVDMVIFTYWMWFFAPCMGTIARMIGHTTKRIALVHNMVPHEPSMFDKIIPPYFIHAMDGFLALSKIVASDIAHINASKPIACSPHPLYDHYGQLTDKQTACKHLQIQPEINYMLFFGFIRNYKGLDWLLKAFSDVRFKNLNVHLIVAGEFYDDEDTYKKLETELGLQGKIKWFNQFIPNSEVRYFFSAADIIVQPYKTATQSGVTQVAYHFEKPMLVTNVGGLSEIVPNGKVGYAVEPDPQKIADALIDFFEKQKQNNFQQGIADEKAKYSWAKLTKAILSLSEK